MVRTRQPQGALTIAPEFAKNCLWLVNGSTGFANIAKRGVLDLPVALRKPTTDGVGFNLAGESSGIAPAPGTLLTYISSTANISYVIAFVQTTAVAWSGIIYDRTGVGGPFVNDTGKFCNEWSGSDWSYDTGLTITNGLFSVGVVSVWPDKVVFALNGRTHTRTVTNAARSGSNNAGGKWFGCDPQDSTGRKFGGAILLAGMWPYESWSEAKAAKISVNPWSLFAAPRPIWQMGFAPSAGGGTDTPIDAAAGSFAVTGAAATLARGLPLNAEVGTFGVTGAAATLARGLPINAAVGTFAVTGADATLARGLPINAAVGTFAVTGADATLEYTQVGVKTLDAQPGAVDVTGADATLTYVPVTHYTLDAQPGSMAVSGSAATLEHVQLTQYVMDAQPGTFVISGVEGTLDFSGGALGGRPLRRRRYLVRDRVYDDLDPADVLAAAKEAGVTLDDVRVVVKEPVARKSAPKRADDAGREYWLPQEFWGRAAAKQKLQATDVLGPDFYTAMNVLARPGATFHDAPVPSLWQRQEQEAILLLLTT